MQSPPLGPPKLHPLPHAEALDALALAGLVVATAWAWAETSRRLREAEARVNARVPRLVPALLVTLSSLALVAFISSRSLHHGRSTGDLALLLLPTLGLGLLALLVRLGRASRWPDFLAERAARRTERSVSSERRAALAESLGQGLQGPIASLESTARQTRHAWLAKEAAATLRSIDLEVHRLKEIQRIALGWAPAEVTHQPTNVSERCRELASRLGATGRRDVSVRFFGIDDLHVTMPARHIDTMLWGVMDTFASAADEQEPIIEVIFTQHRGRLTIDLEHNGAPGLGDTTHENEGIEAARLIAGLHGGQLLPEQAPYGSQVRLVLPDHVIVRLGSLAAAADATTTPITT